MDREQLERALPIVAGVLGLMAVVAILVGTSPPQVPPPVVYEVSTTASDAPPPTAQRPAPAAPRKALAGAYRTTESGLQVWDVEEGAGDPLAEGAVAEVDYVGWLENGIAIESTYRALDPVRFVVGQGKALPGLDEGVRGLRPGGVRQLVIPPALAYGKEGVMNRVPPDATLTFLITLRSSWTVPEARPEAPPEAWTTLDGGARRADVVVGEGATLTGGKVVAMDYAMWANEARVGTSLDKPAPAKVELGAKKLLPAWEAAMMGMKVGGQRLIVLPPELAFGESGRGDEIPPDATITIDVRARRLQ